MMLRENCCFFVLVDIAIDSWLSVEVWVWSGEKRVRP